jgi:type I restriction enzyme S subunit
VKMKSSGIEWAGDVPAHWDAAKICMVARLASGHTPSRQHPEYWVESECTIPWFTLSDVWQLREGREYLGDTKEKISPRGLANSPARLLPAGTVVLSRTASVGFSGIMPRPMATTQDFANWMCGPRMRPEFLLYALRAMRDEFRRMTMGSTHQTIYVPDIRRLEVPVPPLDEQEKIVGHLRQRLPKVDALIAKKERLIELLDEKLTTSTENALSAGRSQVNLGYLVDLLPGYAFSSDEFTQDPAAVRLLRGINIGVGETRWDDVVRWAETSPKVTVRYALLEGDIVLGMDRPWIGGGTRVAIIDKSDLPSVLVQRVLRFRAGNCIRQRYLFLVLSSDRFRRYFEPELTGVSVPHISERQVRAFRVHLPTLEEQDEVIAQIGRLMIATRAATTALRKHAELLREYRQALITAAVTGKIDITSEAA